MPTRPPTIVSRARELEAIERFAEAVPEGPVALVLMGPAGIGKTTLWAEALARAEARGYRVLSSRPTEAEARLSYAALTDLVGESFDTKRRTLPPAQEQALAAALLREEEDEPASARTVATALTSLLGALAADGPLIVAVDDVQWLDSASRRALEFAARRLAGPTGILVAARLEEAADAPLGLGRALPEHRVEGLFLGPLSMGAVHHLVRQRLAMTLPRPVLARTAEASGGNPYFALELARTLTRDAEPPAIGDHVRIPRTLQDIVAAHLHTLSAEATEAALVAASLSLPTAALLAAVGVGERGLAEAEEADVLISDRDRLRFTHPLLASAVYAASSESTRRGVHGRLALVVSGDEERAWHLAQSTIDADVTTADAIEEGARRASGQGAQDAAAELYAAALRLTPLNRPNDTARRLLGCAAALNAVGDFVEARRLADRALEAAGDGALRAEILTFLAGLAWFGGRGGEATALVDRALQEIGDDEDARGKVYARFTRYNFAHDLERAVAYADTGLRVLDEEREPALAGHLLIDRFFGGALRGLGADPALLKRGLELEGRAVPRLPLGPQPMPLIWFHCVDDLDAARARHTFEDDWYRERGQEIWVADRLSHLAVAELHAGDSKAAEHHVETACAALESLDTRGPLEMAFEKRALVDIHRGRIARARATLVAMIEQFEATDGQWWAALTLSTLGLAEYAGGDPAAADAAWRRMHAHAEHVGARDVLLDRSEPLHVEALLALGDLDGARTALGRLERRAHVLPRAWIDLALPRARALVLAAEGDLSAATTLLERLDLGSSRLPFEVGCTLLAKGRLHRRGNQKLVAAEALRGALTIFEQLGSPIWIERTTEELSRVGLRHRAPHELTASERKVAELAAGGMTNRQVAEAAFMSPKTVEANLGRVYRKLGIRSRAELGARLATEERDGRAQT